MPDPDMFLGDGSKLADSELKITWFWYNGNPTGECRQSNDYFCLLEN